ncbi:MAG: hypothetical protein SPJ93_15765, partial [Treponema sp.]|nr:hypothetical protein [Treponema sp.]
RKKQAFQGSVRTSCYLHSFATLRNWLRQPLQSLPLFKIKKLEIEPINKKRDIPFLFPFSFKEEQILIMITQVCPFFTKHRKKLGTDLD